MSGRQNDLEENIVCPLVACARFVEVLERNFGGCLSEPTNPNIS
jgi:hypothetical protein